MRSSSKVRLDRVTRFVLWFTLALLAMLIIFPLGNILVTASRESGREVFAALFSSSVTQQIVKNTILLGVTVGLLGTSIGFLFAYAQTRLEFRGKRILHIISLVPLISPPFAFATAIIILFGRSGIITRDLLGLSPILYGFPGLVIVLTTSFFPVAYMNILGMMRSLDPSLDEAASILGASKFRVFVKVTLPMLIPGIASSFLLLFVESIADLANPLVIGGDFTVLSSRAYIAINGDYDVAAGAAYSVVLLIPGLLVFLLQRYWAQRRNIVSVTGKPSGRISPVESKSAKIALLAVPFTVSFLIVLVYITVIVGGFVKVLGVNNTLTMEHYSYVFSGIGNEAIFKTTLLALIATPLAGIFGMILAWLIVRKIRRGRQAMDFLGMLGIAVPGTVLGIGYAVTFNHTTKLGNFGIVPQLAGGGAIFGGALAIIMVYTIRSSPAGQRSGIAALQQIDPAIDEAASSLGASGVVTFRKITLPLIRGALLTGLMFAFARSMTTLSPIIFITTPDTPIMTSRILSEVDGGRFGNAFAFSSILIVLVLIALGVINLFVKGRPTLSLTTPID
ncbi:MAG: iron ABC transporter permease [Actinobacteria bacterium]|nr:iron ABC transporter permease [Actinomycetota bacterium]